MEAIICRISMLLIQVCASYPILFFHRSSGSNTWTKLTVHGNAPSPRAYSSVLSSGRSLFFAGGVGGGGPLAVDLYMLDTGTWLGSALACEAHFDRNAHLERLVQGRCRHADGHRAFGSELPHTASAVRPFSRVVY